MTNGPRMSAILAGGLFRGHAGFIRRRDRSALDPRRLTRAATAPQRTDRNKYGHAAAIEITSTRSGVSRDLLSYSSIHDRNEEPAGQRRRLQITVGILNDRQQRKMPRHVGTGASGLWHRQGGHEIAPAGPFGQAEPSTSDLTRAFPDGYKCPFRRWWKCSPSPDLTTSKSWRGPSALRRLPRTRPDRLRSGWTSMRW